MLVAIDIETTGLDPMHDEILEIGFVWRVSPGHYRGIRVVKLSEYYSGS